MHLISGVPQRTVGNAGDVAAVGRADIARVEEGAQVRMVDAEAVHRDATLAVVAEVVKLEGVLLQDLCHIGRAREVGRLCQHLHAIPAHSTLNRNHSTV